jgi:hypothetical protein
MEFLKKCVETYYEMDGMLPDFYLDRNEAMALEKIYQMVRAGLPTVEIYAELGSDIEYARCAVGKVWR